MKVWAQPCPSPRINANAAWAVLGSIAQNLIRWVAAFGLRLPGPVATKTIRRRYLALPSRPAPVPAPQLALQHQFTPRSHGYALAPLN